MKKATRQTKKRITKAAIYAKHGITFKEGKILSPIGEICELLKEGNDKTGKLVLTFSLLPGTGSFEIDIDNKHYKVNGTCVCDCKGCYAKTGHYRQNSAIKSMVINTFLTNNYLDFVRACIAAQLEWFARGEVRIHAAGDFNTENSEQYAAMWKDTAKKFNTFRFWTYTKIRKYETLFDDLKNANIVKSIIPNIGFNFGHCEYIINTYYTLKSLGYSVYICKCGFDKEQHCERCGICATYDFVLFLEHSTEYKAEQDPLYPKLYEIVMNQ